MREKREVSATVSAPYETVELRRLGVRVTTGPFGTVFAASEYVSGGVPMINPTHIIDGKIAPDEDHGVSEETARRLSRHRLRQGDLVVGRKGDIGRAALVTKREDGWICGSDSIALHTGGSKIDFRFLSYLMRIPLVRSQLFARSVTATMPSLNEENLLQLCVPDPPREVQQRIANFLDTETTKLDQLIFARKKQIRLLGELGLSRAHAMLRGADEPGNRVPSGLDWLGDIPADWPVAPVSSQFEVQLGKMLNQERTSGDHLKPYLRVLNVQWDHVDTAELAEMNFPPRERRRYEVIPGDLLICEGGSYPGRAAIWDGSISEIYYQKALHRARSRGHSLTRWLYYCLRVARAMSVFEVEGNATTMTHLTGEQLAVHRFPFPDPTVQKRLVRDLDIAAESDQMLLTVIDRQIALLTERRHALITAAVTGQIDVTTARGAGV